MERATALEAAPTSVRAARRFVADALTDWHLSVLVETAELLVSELVTNALLHAHTDVELVARLGDGRLRIEVRDASTVLPTTGSHHQESQTGRGLQLVELLADSWGVDVDHGRRGIEGKAVWFELSTSSPSGRAHLPGPSSRRAPSPAGVCFEGVPTALYRASEEHRLGVTREFVLMTIDDAEADDVPARLVALNEELAQRFAAETATTVEQVEAAERRGDETLNLFLELPPDASSLLLAMVELLEEADRFCERGAILTMAANAEIRAFRRWWVDEVVGQLAGGRGTPWRRG